MDDTYLSYENAALASGFRRESRPKTRRNWSAITPGNASVPSSRGQVARVLILDDDTGLLAELGELVCLWGYQAITFSVPSAVLGYLGENHADVLISDFDMPEMSGWQLASLVADRHRCVKIGLMTGGTSSYDVRHGRWPLFSKPVAPDCLQRFVETSIGDMA